MIGEQWSRPSLLPFLTALGVGSTGSGFFDFTAAILLLVDFLRQDYRLVLEIVLVIGIELV